MNEFTEEKKETKIKPLSISISDVSSRKSWECVPTKIAFKNDDGKRNDYILGYQFYYTSVPAPLLVHLCVSDADKIMNAKEVMFS